MNANILNFLIGFSASVGANKTTAAASATFQKVLHTTPHLEKRIAQSSSPQELQSAFAEVGLLLQILAGSGSIPIDGALITAFRSARLGRPHGRVQSRNTVVCATVLQAGGTGPVQTTNGGNRGLGRGATNIRISQGYGIVTTGNAGIKQN